MRHATPHSEAADARHDAPPVPAVGLDALDELGAIWGPVKPLTRTDVIREMLRRTLPAERRRPSRRTETDKAK